MKSNLIVMLTHNDQTVKDAIEVFDQCKDLPVQYWGFKDVGLDAKSMRQLIDNMKEAGKTTCLEVVSYSQEECMAGAKLAVEYGFDYLMGTIYYEHVHDFLKNYDIEYQPFCGKVSGSPSVLEGTIQEIIDDALRLKERGINGIDLLAYRHAQGEQLAREFFKAVSGKNVIAGSINSVERLKIMSEISPWGFTMGGALFMKDFDPNESFRGNLELVIKHMNTLD